MAEAEIEVGFDSYSYNHARNIYSPVPGVRYKKVQRAAFDVILGRRAPSWLAHSYFPLAFRRVDLLHTWNRINWGPGIWGTTFESQLPRFFLDRNHWLVRAGVERLASERCRFLIGMSGWAKELFLGMLDDESRALLSGKLHCVYPAAKPQEHREPYRAPDETEPLRMIFVGSDFVRKGGEAIIRAFRRESSNLDLRLIIVSRISAKEPGSNYVTPVELERMKALVRSDPRIDWYDYLEQDQLLPMMMRAHVGLHPTLQDTFGYTVMEYLEHGTPVITTDISALPEIVADEAGWKINLTRDETGYWKGHNVSGVGPRDLYDAAIEEVSAQLQAIWREVRASPNILVTKSDGAKRHVRTAFDPKKRAARLRRIYEGARG